MDDAGVLMKLDAIKISGRYRNLTNRGGTGPIKALEQRLRKFFDEDDGHGSLRRKPPADLMTPQYFKLEVPPGSCNPIRRMDWIAFVNYANYKKLAKTMVKKPSDEPPPPPIWAQKKDQKPQQLAPPAPAASAVMSVTPETQTNSAIPKEVSIVVSDVENIEQLEQKLGDSGQIGRRQSIVNIMVPKDETPEQRIERRQSIISIIVPGINVTNCKQMEPENDVMGTERRQSIIPIEMPDTKMTKQVEQETGVRPIERHQSIISIVVSAMDSPEQIERETDVQQGEHNQSIEVLSAENSSIPSE